MAAVLPDRATHAAYTEMGRVSGALAAYADGVVERIRDTSPALDAVRLLMLRLVHTGPDGAVFLVPQRLDDLDPPLRAVAEHLAADRLVVIREGADAVVTLAHAALAVEWGLLRGWLDSDPAFRSWLDTVRRAVSDWRTDRDPGRLLRGAALLTAENWLTRKPEGFTATEREFVEASVAERAREHAARRRAARRMRIALVALSAALVVALVSAGVAVWSADRAERQRTALTARVVAEEGTTQRAIDSSLGTQLVLAGYRMLPESVLTRKALLSAFAQPYSTRLPNGGNVETVALDSTGTLMVAGGDEKVLRLWDVRNHHRPRELPRVPGHAAKVYNLVFHRDRPVLVSGDEGGAVRVWDMSDPSAVELTAEVVTGGTGVVWGLDLHDDLLAIGHLDGTLQLRDLHDLAGVPVLNTRIPGGLGSLAFSPDGALLAVGTADGHVRIHTRTGDLLTTSRRATGRTVVAFARDGRLAVGGEDGWVRLFTVDRAGGLTELGGRPDGGKVIALTFSPDGRTLASPRSTSPVVLLDVSGRGVGSDIWLSGHRHWSTDAAYHPDGRFLVTSSGDHDVRVWSLPLPALRVHPAPVLQAVASPDGRLMATVGEGAIARLWDLTDPAGPRFAHELVGHTATVEEAAFTADSRTLITVGSDARMITWNTRDPRRPQKVREVVDSAAGGMLSARFTPDGNRLVVGHTTGRITLWDWRKGVKRADAHGGVADVFALYVAAGPDGGTRVVAGGLASGSRMWQAGTAGLAEQGGCRRTTARCSAPRCPPTAPASSPGRRTAGPGCRT
ncbi:WD40 repeat domain-containing protein [Actinokineospora soli]|uniref:WD40 repeat domain-containing protein n=1 Tax=Actinokineospora soli TaxID=1048753 RepID=A0ABW2TRQ8_9PSEU